MGDVNFPGNTYAPHDDDLAAPTADLLRALGLLEAPNASASALRTPESVQVIRAGATTISKVATGLLATGGVAATWLSFVQVEWQSATDSVKVAGLVGLAVVVAAIAIGIAMIVRADVLGRSQATVSRVQTQGTVATQFLALTSQQQLARRESSERAAANGLRHIVETIAVQVGAANGDAKS